MSRTIDGRFEVEGVAGEGGMGTVYRARDRLTSELVAVKVMLGSGAEEGERFLREGRVLADLFHPGIVRYVAHGVTEAGERYLAMEWLEGEDLAHRLERAPLSLRDALQLGARVARALAAMHARGMVHRDVKPSNLLLVGREPGDPKVLDLGIVRTASDGVRVTRSGAAIGTPAYMAPEQVRAASTVDARADVFALGAVLHESLSGARAFPGDNAMAVLARVLFEPVEPIGGLVDVALPPMFEALLAAMLDKDPERRPEDGAAAARALEEIASQEGLGGSIRPKMPPSMRVLTAAEQLVAPLLLAASGDAGDPEIDWRAIPSVRRARVERAAHGATLVAFTGEDAATDRARSAARVALLLREASPGRAISIATGPIVVSPNGRGLLLGGVVDRAAAALERGGGIAIDDATAQLLDARFTVADGELLGETPGAPSVRTVLGRQTSCAGRERELAMLGAVLDEVGADGVARCVLVVGGPGIGKSRLLQEFLARAGPHSALAVWSARADPVGQGSPFALLAQALRGAAGVVADEPLATRQAKVAAFVGRELDGADAARLTDFVAELVGAPFEVARSAALTAARADPMLMGDEMRRAFQDLARAETQRRPLLIVLEDLHWGDRSTVLAVDAALRNLRDRPLMVLALARPEVTDLFPRVFADRALTEIRLQELSRRAAEALALEVLGAGADRGLVGSLVDRAAGNPFYLEELLRHVDGRASAGPRSLPSTVLAMLHARLDALEPDERRVLRAGSVFGEVFWRDAVLELVGRRRAADVDAWLDALVARELIERRGTSRFGGHAEYTFRHGLVRDAAYAMLTEDDRSSGHRGAGKWLEDAGESNPMVLAEHFVLGGLQDRAAASLGRAAERALEGNDFDAAIAHAEAAIAAGATGERAGALRFLQAQACRWLGDFERVAVLARQARRPFAPGSATWLEASGELVGATGRFAHADDVVPIAAEIEASPRRPEARKERAIALYRAATAMLQAGRKAFGERLVAAMGQEVATMEGAYPAVEARLHAVRGTQGLMAGNPGVLLEESLAAIRLLRDVGDLRSACLAGSNAAYAALELGAYDVAESVAASAMAEGERMGITSTVGVADLCLGRAFAGQGRLTEALTVLGEAAALLEKQGNRRKLASTHVHLALVRGRLGEVDAALDHARTATGLLTGTSPDGVPAHAALARALLDAGRVAEAVAAAERAAELLTSLGAIEEGEAFARLIHAEVAEAAGDRGAARARIAAALRRMNERAVAIDKPAWRRAFLAKEAHVRTVALARAWG